MRPKRPSPAMAVALLALVMSMTGGAIAAVNFARNAGAVDGKSAVGARSSTARAAGKLVATYPTGELRGKLPFRFLSGVPSSGAFDALDRSAARGKAAGYLVPVTDNAVTQEQNLIDLGVGNLQLSCIDKDPTVGVEDPSVRVAISNYSSSAIDVSRRLGTGRQFIRTLDPGAAEVFEVNNENTFSAQVFAPPSRSALIEGTAFQRGSGSGDASCAAWATAVTVG